MSRAVVPIANLQRRLPEAGRIRTGVKTARAMRAIDTFRFTSADGEAITQVAALYGGKAQPWKDAPTPGQFEVITEAAEIDIVLPPDPLGGSPIYELWSGGGCERRCDGVTCQVVTKGPEGPEYADTPCICVAKGEMPCTPHTRLSVLLPDVRFAGTWRYESAKSWAVAQEMPSMVQLIQQAQAGGLTRAKLALEHRKSTSGGTTHRFTVPVLRVPESLNALVAGAAQVGALPSAAPQIAAGDAATPSPVEPAPDPAPSPAASDDEMTGRVVAVVEDIVDAEVIEDLDIVGVWESVSMSPTKALKHARLIAEKKGLPLPLSVDEVTGDLARFVMNDLATEANA